MVSFSWLMRYARWALKKKKGDLSYNIKPHTVAATCKLILVMAIIRLHIIDA